MASNYTKNFSQNAGDIITNTMFEVEYQLIDDAFNATTGHKHDGSTDEGGPITVIRDADSDTKIHVEASANEDIIRFYLGNATLTSAAEIMTLQAINTTTAKLEPTTDNILDLGSSSNEFKDLYIDGIAYIDDAQIGQLSAALDANSQAITNVDINSGSIDGVTIGAAAAGAITCNALICTTLNTGGKLTAGANEIEGSNFDINGGDISAGTISGGLTWSSAQDLNSQALTNVNIDSGDVSAITVSGSLTWSAAQNLNSQALTNVNIDSGDISAATISGGLTWSATQDFNNNELQQPKIKDYSETVNALGDLGGGTDNINIASGNVVTATVSTSEQTFTFSNPGSTDAYSFTLILTNGGSQTVNWPASVQWEAGTEPNLTSSGVDILAFLTVDNGTTWYGFNGGLNFS